MRSKILLILVTGLMMFAAGCGRDGQSTQTIPFESHLEFANKQLGKRLVQVEVSGIDVKKLRKTNDPQANDFRSIAVKIKYPCATNEVCQENNYVLGESTSDRPQIAFTASPQVARSADVQNSWSGDLYLDFDELHRNSSLASRLIVKLHVALLETAEKVALTFEGDLSLYSAYNPHSRFPGGRYPDVFYPIDRLIRDSGQIIVKHIEIPIQKRTTQESATRQPRVTRLPPQF